MKRIIRRILIAFFVVRFLVALVFPVGAINNEYVSSGSFWNWIADHGNFVQSITGYFPGSGSCPSSEDTYHHASSYQKEGNVDGDIRYRCICDYCHQSFTAYASDLQQSYDAQVAELPAPVYGLDGALRWRLNVDRFDEYYGSVSSFLGGTTYNVEYSGHFSSYQLSARGYFSEFLAPVSGTYTLYAYYIVNLGLGSLNTSTEDGPGYYLGLDRYEIGYTDTSPVSGVLNKFSSVNFLSGDKVIKRGTQFYLSSGKSYSVCSITGYWEVACVPATPLSGNTYNITSRPTSITGDYGIIGDNGQIIKVEGDKIVNETNNNYFNPATGETTTITDWSYNYEDRSYTVTTEAGDTVTITYGDENVTIKEGDTIYNIYYLVDGSGSENPGPGPGPEVCDHTWAETSRTDPTCSTPGKVTSTCSKCSQTKTDPIPAAGHSWVVDRTVQTTYDEEGNLLQQGYTIYSCSVCGEQYKDMEGTGPPGPEGEKSIWEKIGDFFGTIGGGFIDIINAIAGKLLDALISLAEMMMEKFKTIVETILSIFDEVPALFGGFLDFLAAIFPFLPPEITTILTFGVIAITSLVKYVLLRRSDLHSPSQLQLRLDKPQQVIIPQAVHGTTERLPVKHHSYDHR